MIWFALGLTLGVGAALLITRVRAGTLKVRWYQWPLGLVAFGMLLMALQNYLACQEELEPRLALYSLLAFGLPAALLVFLLLAIPLIGRRKSRDSAT